MFSFICINTAVHATSATLISKKFSTIPGKVLHFHFNHYGNSVKISKLKCSESQQSHSFCSSVKIRFYKKVILQS